MVPGGRPLIAIGYNYNLWKVIYFIVIEFVRTTNSGPPYLSKYTDQFSNFSICPVSRPLVMYKFFGSVNDVESHNKSRWSDLALEKLWVTQRGWIRLYATVTTEMNINNCWKLFSYGVKRDNYDKSIGIR